ncbi:tripartite tricarboxylate transporter substrate binding protein [uncultured Acidaminococcus sp.]|uniref:Bug family tripartite tricarboxylate transporter substrate binding protein n=1 Tax=uncultured Acidaminococcus sp. TaxID=352152 RepID=UPI0026758497|nr:tripartite tricarboxylate transporter substrate binding protein [uncultured Acidaminococcus sp.]
MKKSLIKLSLAVLTLTAVFSLAGCGKSSSKYPSKDIQFYVSADAGGGTDAISRKVTQLIEKDKKAKFYLVNKPGVMDSVGPQLVMNADANGYNIGNVNYSNAVTAQYQQIVEGYNIDKLRFVCLVTQEADALMVSKNAPFQDFKGMIDYAKAHPGEVRVADQGIGSRVYLVLNMLEHKYGIKFNKISYQNSAPQREAILNGEVDMAITSLGDFASLLASGDCKGIVEFSSQRNQTYPDVPTALELGMDKSFLSGSFLAIVVPKKTSDEVVNYLNDAFKEAVESNDFKEWTKTVGVTAHYMGPKEVEAYVKDMQKKDFKALDELKAQGILK